MLSRRTRHPSSLGATLRIVLVYAVFASLWILLSDKAVAWLFTDPGTMTWVSMVKGWLFVAVTALLLFGLIQRLADGLQDAIVIVSQSEKALKQSENQLQATLDALPDLLFEVDREGRIVNYHSHRSDLLAAPPELFMGKRFAELLPADATLACQSAIDEAAQAGFSTGVTYRLALPQGEHWFELSVSHLSTDARLEQRFIMIARDITERKRAEKDLQLAAGVFSHSQEGITITDVQGTIIDVNAAFSRITGYSRDEVIGQNPRILRSGRQDAAFYADMWNALLVQGHWSGVCRGSILIG